MTDVSPIDASYRHHHFGSGRSPLHDFAEELTKGTGKTSSVMSGASRAVAASFTTAENRSELAKGDLKELPASPAGERVAVAPIGASTSTSLAPARGSLPLPPGTLEPIRVVIPAAGPAGMPIEPVKGVFQVPTGVPETPVRVSAASAVSPAAPIRVSATLAAAPADPVFVQTDVAANEAPIEVAPMMSTQEQILLNTVVQPTGITEALLGSRVYGVHLLAGAYLSELVVSESEGELTGPHAETPQLTEQAVAQEPAASVLLDVNTDVPDESLPTQALVSAIDSVAESESSMPTDDIALANTAASDGTSTLLWSERSLRFTPQRDGTAIAWVRDYRLESREAPRLIEALRGEAKAKGLLLSKIMLNGREAWSSRGNQ
jgi:hypothetical protein